MGRGSQNFFYDEINTVCFYTDGHILGYTIEDVEKRRETAGEFEFKLNLP